MKAEALDEQSGLEVKYVPNWFFVNVLLTCFVDKSLILNVKRLGKRCGYILMNTTDFGLLACLRFPRVG